MNPRRITALPQDLAVLNGDLALISNELRKLQRLVDTALNKVVTEQPVSASYATIDNEAAKLSRSRRLAAGSNITLTDGGAGGALTIAADASPVASYVTVNAEAGLTQERRLAAGANIKLTDGGANGTLTVAAAILTTVAFSATPTFDAGLGNSFKLTLSGNVTSSTLSNAVAGQIIEFILVQDATGGRTFVWPPSVKGGMTISGGANTVSAQSFLFDGTNAYAVASGVTGM